LKAIAKCLPGRNSNKCGWLFYGERNPRRALSTLDVDFVSELKGQQVDDLVAALENEF